MASFTRQEALDYHRRGRPGKIQIAPTKPLDSQLHLSLSLGYADVNRRKFTCSPERWREGRAA